MTDEQKFVFDLKGWVLLPALLLGPLIAGTLTTSMTGAVVGIVLSFSTTIPYYRGRPQLERDVAGKAIKRQGELGL